MLKKHVNDIGKTVKININDLYVNCKILDIKKSYGNVDYLITPVSGNGKTWKRNITF